MAMLKRKSPTGDQERFDIAVLTLHWPRTVPGLGQADDVYSDVAVSAALREWWETNKTSIPGNPDSMDNELIDSLWFDVEKWK